MKAASWPSLVGLPGPADDRGTGFALKARWGRDSGGAVVIVGAFNEGVEEQSRKGTPRGPASAPDVPSALSNLGRANLPQLLQPQRRLPAPPLGRRSYGVDQCAVLCIRMAHNARSTREALVKGRERWRSISGIASFYLAGLGAKTARCAADAVGSGAFLARQPNDLQSR